mmetsp:Transcript_40690/g.39292  ORF Transcript_40690/g.39292 Transcript_40690/m.39292 type:complete len:167 (+) Transcript_40690:1053-1553(+)
MRTAYWKKYQNLNQDIAQKVIEVKNIFSKQNLKSIWVHDNHLLLVPYFLKKSFFEANIGFFFHSPFPSSDIFRMFRYRVQVLHSLLSCDLVGFHLFEYARNFFKSCHRLLGLEYEFRMGGYLCINFHGKNVVIRVSHVGVDQEFVEELMKSKKYRNILKSFKDQLA